LLPGLDPALGKFAAQTIGFDDEATAVDFRISREGDVLGAAAPPRASFAPLCHQQPARNAVAVPLTP